MTKTTATLIGLSIASMVAILIIWVPPACAEQGDLSLELTFASLHLPRDRAKKADLNEFNFGAGLMYGVTDWMDIKAGGYKNTFHKTSLYGGANFKRQFTLWEDPVFDDHKWFIAPGIMVGAVTGYQDTPVDIVDKQVFFGFLRPVVLPNVQFGHRNLFATVGFMPAFKKEQVTTVTFQLGIRLWP